MRARLIRWLRVALLWLEGPPTPPPVRPDPVLDRARVLVRAQAEQTPAASGESKRHQVYARLIKDFPEARKRDLAFAIERVVQEGIE